MNKARWGLVLLVAAYLLLYARAAGFGFVWDDFENVVDNPLYEVPLARSLRATQHDHMEPGALQRIDVEVPYESYRPLLFLSYRIDDSLFDRHPGPMHAHGLLLGVVCILLAYGLCRRVTGDEPSALAATAIFALHPVQTEVFCYVSARGDLLATLFGLAAGVAFFAATEAGASSRRRGVSSLALFAAVVLALTAKESGAGLPVALLLLAWAVRPAGPRRVALPFATSLAALAAYLVLRGALLGAEQQGLDRGNAVAALAGLPALGLDYLRLFLVPSGLSIERPPPGPFSTLPGWGAVVVLAALSVAAGSGRLGRARPSVLAVGAGFFGFLALLGPSALAVHSTGVAADRYVHLALLWPALALATTARELGRYAQVSRPLPVAAGVWGVALLGVTAFQISTWRDNATLYAHALRVEPGSSMAHYRVGYLHARHGEWGESLAYFETAARLDARNIRALNNLGVAYLKLARIDAAEGVLRRTLQISGGKHFRAWNNLAEVHFARSQRREGCAALREALAVHPGYSVARHSLVRRCEVASG